MFVLMKGLQEHTVHTCQAYESYDGWHVYDVWRDISGVISRHGLCSGVRSVTDFPKEDGDTAVSGYVTPL